MPFLLLVHRFTSALLGKFGWVWLLMAIALHAAVSYGGLVAFSENHLIEPLTFVYYYLTTALTVGYGDLAPQTPFGRVFVATWVMLGGIALLTATIGKVTNTAIEFWRKRVKGKASFAGCTGHTVVIGWDAGTSERVIDLLHEDETSSDHLIVIAAAELEENPLPGQVEFVKGESLFSTALLKRAGVMGAERVLIRTACDDQTLAAVLAVHTLNPTGHVVAHFNSSETAALARAYAPKLECTSNMATELLVRASQDPGSSVVINELLCVGQGATQYGMTLPETFSSTFGELYRQLKDTHNATLIGYRPSAQAQPVINPPNDMRITGGELFYIANARITEISTHELA